MDASGRDDIDVFHPQSIRSGCSRQPQARVLPSGSA